MNLAPDLELRSSRSACSSSCSFWSHIDHTGASAPGQLTSTIQRMSWFTVPVAISASESRRSRATSMPACALALLLLASMVWFVPVMTMEISPRQCMTRLSYRSALADLPAISTSSTEPSSGTVATPSLISASSPSSNPLRSSSVAVRGSLPTANAEPYFSAKVSQNRFPPLPKITGQ